VPVPGIRRRSTSRRHHRPSRGQWQIRQSSDGVLEGSTGRSTDVPVPDDYDGGGTTDLCRPSTGDYLARLRDDRTSTGVNQAFRSSRRWPIAGRPAAAGALGHASRSSSSRAASPVRWTWARGSKLATGIVTTPTPAHQGIDLATAALPGPLPPQGQVRPAGADR
jgi:hypothetical protein